MKFDVESCDVYCLSLMLSVVMYIIVLFYHVIEYVINVFGYQNYIMMKMYVECCDELLCFVFVFKLYVCV